MPTITVPATLEYLNEVKAYVKASIPEAYAKQTANVLLVAEELLVNVFSYAYPDGRKEKAEISIASVPDGEDTYLEFSVRDWGKRFNPFEETAAPDLEADIESRAVGGLGIFLIKEVSASQSWHYEEGEKGSNVIRIRFRPDSCAKGAL